MALLNPVGEQTSIPKGGKSFKPEGGAGKSFKPEGGRTFQTRGREKFQAHGRETSRHRGEKRGYREAGRPHCDVPSKGKTRTNTVSLSTFKQVFCLLTNANAKCQSATMNCAEIISASISISIFPLFVIPAIMQNS